MRAPFKRLLFRLAAAAVILIAVLAAYVLFPWPVPAPASFDIASHRGVHQTFPLEGIEWDTCTAELIYPPTHDLIENTLPSMQAAFEHGATVVELDVRKTADGHLVVFHDFGLDCRTDGTGLVSDYTLVELRKLDIGYGYTADGGQTYPLRGKGVGLMPTLEEVLDAFPDRRFVIHDKDADEETMRLLIGVLAQVPPEQRRLLAYWGKNVRYDQLRAEIPEIQRTLYTYEDARACAPAYAGMLFGLDVPEDCRELILGAPLGKLAQLPGWPNLILARAHQAGMRVWITDVDTPEQLDQIIDLPIDGVMTNRIEVIGPLLAERAAGR